jgi:predicted MFS family arabinose efflux permease
MADERAPWRERDFRLVLGGGLVNDIGDWLLMIALPVYVLTATGSGSATAALFAIEYGVAMVLGPYGGRLVDGWDLRRTLVVTNLLQAVLLLPLLAVTPHRVWPAFAVAAAQAILGRVNNPANAAIVPRLVAPDQLVAANAALASSSSLARLIGSPLGGVIVELAGLRAVVVLDGLSFLAVAGAMWLVRRPAPLEGSDAVEGTSDSGSALDGLRLVRRRPTLRRLMLLIGATQLAQGMFVVLFVAFVLRQLDAGASAVGLIRGVQAVGGLVGGLAIARWSRRWHPGVLASFGLLGMGALSALTWNAPVVTTAVVAYGALFVLAGVPSAAIGVGLMTTAQQVTPPAFMGRVVGTAEAVGLGGAAVGSIVAGLALDRVSITTLLDTQAMVYVLAGAFAWWALVREPALDDRSAAMETRGPSDAPAGAEGRRTA